MVSEDYLTRFAGISRLIGASALERLRTAHVAVVGLGGVGSWAVEALARSGVGAITLIDLDEVCLSNVNRQLPALDGTVGRFKGDVLAERVQAINPACLVHPITEFFTAESEARLLATRYDALVDAIDAVGNKARLIAGSCRRGLPVVVCGAAGGRLDPARITVADLAKVTHDRLLAEVRRRLRREYGFPAPGRSLGVPCVFSPEPPRLPRADGSVCGPGDAEAEGPPVRRLNCDWGFGSASFVTGAFGFAAASWVIRHLASQLDPTD